MGNFDFLPFVSIGLVFLVFYFFLIRPQQKRAQQQNLMLDALKKGDKVLTSGGLMGIVAENPSEREILLEVCDGVRVKFLKTTITEIIDASAPLSMPQAVEKSGPKGKKSPAAGKRSPQKTRNSPQKAKK